MKGDLDITCEQKDVDITESVKKVIKNCTSCGKFLQKKWVSSDQKQKNVCYDCCLETDPIYPEYS